MTRPCVDCSDAEHRGEGHHPAAEHGLGAPTGARHPGPAAGAAPPGRLVQAHLQPQGQAALRHHRLGGTRGQN